MSGTSKTKYANTRKNTSKTSAGKLLEGLGLKSGLSAKQLQTKLATMSQKAVQQALKYAKLVGGARGAAIGSAATFLLGKGAKSATSKVRKDSRDARKKKSTRRSSLDADIQKAINKYVKEKAPPKKPKEIDKIGAVRVPLKKPKGMK
tara:strand:- start:43 stop:486 length:444 start_codon:yes stop_codon:yes gene_type:complete